MSQKSPQELKEIIETGEIPIYRTALDACAAGNKKLVKSFVEKYPDVIKDAEQKPMKPQDMHSNDEEDGETLFGAACREGQLAIARYLLSVKDSIDLDVHHGEEYALRHASRKGKTLMVKWLLGLNLDKPININALSDNAWESACEGGHLQILKYLQAYSKKHNMQIIYNSDGDVVPTICENGHMEVLKYLIEELGLFVGDAEWKKDCQDDIYWFMECAADNDKHRILDYIRCIYNHMMGKEIPIPIEILYRSISKDSRDAAEICLRSLTSIRYSDIKKLKEMVKSSEHVGQSEWFDELLKSVL